MTAATGRPVRAFRPRLLMSLLALAGVALFASLGQWQAGRATQKLALQAELDARSSGPAVPLPREALSVAEWSWRRVAVQGEFVAGRTFFVDNRIYRGVAGYHVVTPLRLAGSGMHVLVNRGWVASGGRRDVLPDIATPAGPQRIEGIAIPPPAGVYELAADSASGRVRQHLLPERFAAETGLAVMPVFLRQDSAAADALVRDWPRPDARADTHRAYALQWYAFALLTVILWGGLNIRRQDESARI